MARHDGPTRVGYINQAKGRKPHPLLTKLMRAKLSEHSRHLERQHADAFGPVDDGDATAYTAAAAADDDDAKEGADAAGALDKDAFSPAGAASGGGAASASGGRARAVSPSQRRVAQMLRIETEHGASALVAADSLSPSGRKLRDRGASMSPSPRRMSTSRSSFGHASPKQPQKEDAQVQTSPKQQKKRPPTTLSTTQALTLFTRLHKESLQKNVTPDPEETFKPVIGAKSRVMAAKVHSRENQGLGRLDYLVKNGTEKLRGKKKPLEQETWKRAERAPESRTIDPSEFHLDGMGRTGKTGDRYVRALRREEDAKEAEEECTFRPKLSAETIKMTKETPYLKHTTFYERGVAWAERKKRAVEASRKAKEDEAERDCTFQPRIQNQIPTYMREIAAQQRMQRLAASTSEGSWGGAAAGGDGPMDGVSGAIVAAAARSGGWMSPPRRVTNWQESLGVSYNPRAYNNAGGGGVRSVSAGRSRSAPRLRPGDEGGGHGHGHDAWETPGGDDAAAAYDDGFVYGGEGEFGGGGGSGGLVVGDIVLPTPPPDVHPGMKRRESNHIPIHSSLSHYRFRDDGVKEVDRLEDARLAERPKTPGRIRGGGDAAAGGGAGGAGLPAPALGGGAPHPAHKYSKHVDYFERLHMERVQKARNEERAKVQRLNKCDGSGWKNRVTQPVEFQFNRRPDKSSIKALQRPIPAKQPASLSNSVSSLQSFMAANQGVYRYADFVDNETPTTGGGGGAAGRGGGGGGGGGGGADGGAYDDGEFSGFEGYYQQRGGGVGGGDNGRQQREARGPRGWYPDDDDYRRDDDSGDYYGVEEDGEGEAGVHEEEEDWETLRDERMRHRAQYVTPGQRFDEWGDGDKY